MSAKPVPDPKEAAEHRERMKAFYAKVAMNGLTPIPDDAKGPTGASGRPQKPVTAAGVVDRVEAKPPVTDAAGFNYGPKFRAG